MQHTVRRLPLYPARKIRSPAATGEELPPGTFAFQSRFIFGPNSIGRPRASETPDPFGPRKPGQSEATVTTLGRNRQKEMPARFSHRPRALSSSACIGQLNHKRSLSDLPEPRVNLPPYRDAHEDEVVEDAFGRQRDVHNHFSESR